MGAVAYQLVVADTPAALPPAVKKQAISLPRKAQRAINQQHGLAAVLDQSLTCKGTAM